MVHVLLPPQFTVVPVSTVRVHSLPPEQSTVLSVPVSRVHSLVPAHFEVQLAVQLPSHTERPAQVASQPEPHVRSQVFRESQ
jgi:hypothetical protein